jgi:SAM-dependent methyltransferase
LDYRIPDKPNLLPEIHYESLGGLETKYWWHQSRLNWAQRIISNHIIGSDNLKALDYGCGTGGFIYQLNKRMSFDSVMGVDVSAKAIEIASQYGNCYNTISPGDFSLVTGNNIVFLMDILEHIDDDEGFLGDLQAPLKSGSHILISVPSLDFLFSSWDKALGHYRRYSKKSLKRLAGKAGLKVRFVRYGFSYLIPAVIFRRFLIETNFDEHNCEFPPVPDFLNTILLQMNLVEMFGSKFINYPFGCSLFCLMQKP